MYTGQAVSGYIFSHSVFRLSNTDLGFKNSTLSLSISVCIQTVSRFKCSIGSPNTQYTASCLLTSLCIGNRKQDAARFIFCFTSMSPNHFLTSLRAIPIFLSSFIIGDDVLNASIWIGHKPYLPAMPSDVFWYTIDTFSRGKLSCL